MNIEQRTIDPLDERDYFPTEARAKVIQSSRVRADMENHIARIAWLEADNPKWSDGTAVSTFDRVDLLRQSRAFVNAHKAP
jgi:hypothetical protein